MREIGLTLLFVVLLAATSCGSTTPLPSHEVYVAWPGATHDGGEDIPLEYETWYEVKAFSVVAGTVLTMYAVDDSVSHQGSVPHLKEWTLPDDNDYFATIAAWVKLPNGTIVVTCGTDTVDVFSIEIGDCAIVPREE